MGEIRGIVPMTVDEFFSIPTGTHIYNYGNDQCVALANLYDAGTLKLPLPPGIQSAFQWWTTYSQKPELYENFTQISENPQRGDIFVSKGGIYDATHGHIGVVERSWNGSTFGTMENGYWNGTSSMKRFSRNMSYILGFLRPNNFTPPQPQPELKEEEMKILSVAGAAYLVGKGYCARFIDHTAYAINSELYGKALQLANLDDWNRCTWVLGIPVGVREELDKRGGWAIWEEGVGYYDGSIRA